MSNLEKYREHAEEAILDEDVDRRRTAVSKLLEEVELDFGYIEERRSAAEEGVVEMINRERFLRHKLDLLKPLIESLASAEGELNEKIDSIQKLFNTL